MGVGGGGSDESGENNVENTYCGGQLGRVVITTKRNKVKLYSSSSYAGLAMPQREIYRDIYTQQLSLVSLVSLVVWYYGGMVVSMVIRQVYRCTGVLCRDRKDSQA